MKIAGDLGGRHAFGKTFLYCRDIDAALPTAINPARSGGGYALDPRMRGSVTFDNDTCFARHMLLRGVLSATT